MVTIRTAGRQGDGPREFRAILGAWQAAADTLVIYDPVTGRITSLSDDGEVIASYQYQPMGMRQPGQPSPNLILGRFSDGSFLAHPNADAPVAEADGVVQSPYPLLRVSADARTVDTITVVPGRTFFRINPRSDFIDGAGNVWLEHFAIDQAEPTLWSVFDEDGVFAGEVQTPTNLRITEIGPDFVLGIWTGELDVESVREFRLIKPAS